MLILGLTGGSGTDKPTIPRIRAGLDAYTINADGTHHPLTGGTG